MKPHCKNFLTLLSLAFLTLSFSYGQVALTLDKKDGIYNTGENALWTLELQEGTVVDSIGYTLKKGGLTISKKGYIYPKNKKATISYYFNEPGAVLLNINWKDENNEEQNLIGGAIASPEEIALSAKRPDDFDSFWGKQIESLNKIPKNTTLKKESSAVKGVNYYNITMNNIRGTHIQGQLARPAKGKNFPALLIVQWAGIYPLQKEWVLNMAKNGWLVLNISAHDLPIHETESFYEEQSNGPLKNYPSIGNEDKNTSYFLRMYLSCYRAAEYLTERKDWNGETLVVTGGSQGGLQSLMTAGLHPKITAALALVPAGFDMHGPVVGRKGGWPQWYNAIEDKNSQKVREASRYFDVANFVPHIKCPILVGIGLLDEVCPPEGIYAGINLLKSNKEIILLPNSGHQNNDDSQQPYYQRMMNDWLPALMKGDDPLAKK